MLGVLLLLSPPEFVHSPFSDYRSMTLHGFSVYVSPAAKKNWPNTEPALKLLNQKLALIVRAVPKKSLENLRKIKFFVEDNNPRFPCACYHVSKDWLVENGHIPEKENSVEISNPANFISWSKEQPWMVLHELAHGYHWTKFTYDEPKIVAALESAKSKGIYDAVKRYNGKVERHYALTNAQEYFAECTEAYFGKNDFFPFNRKELKAVDPVGFAAVEWAWGVK